MDRAVVIFSGGQDSTTCLFWAINRYEKVEAITFDYGQNHCVEIVQSKKICKIANVKQTIIDLAFLNQIVDSAMISNVALEGKVMKGVERDVDFIHWLFG